MIFTDPEMLLSRPSIRKIVLPRPSARSIFREMYGGAEPQLDGLLTKVILE